MIVTDSAVDWANLPALPSDKPRSPIRVRPYPDHHFPNSRVMIAEAAAGLAGDAGTGRVQVLGAGSCSDIPVAALAERFGEVVLCDIEEERLRNGVRSQTDLRHPGRVRLDVRDIADSAAAFRRLAEAELSSVSDPRTATDRLAALMERTHPPPARAGGIHDMTVCSGVLTQVDFPVWKAAIGLLESRFGKPFDRALTQRLRLAQRPMGHRFRVQLVGQLAEQTRGGGRLYLADTMRVAHLEGLAPGGEWLIRGAYQMGMLADLSEYLDRRLIIETRREWDWVDVPKPSSGEGRLWRVQALIVTRRPERGVW